MSENPNEKPVEQPQEHRRRFSIFWPVMLIALGVVLFIQNTGAAANGGWDLLRLWPLLLIVGGLDSFWKGEGFVGGVVWIGIGGIFLLNNLGYIPGFNIWSFIIRFWPVLLVALGLDLMIGKKRVWSPVLGVVVGLLLVGGVAWLMVAAPLQSNLPGSSETISIPANDLTSAEGALKMAVGKLTLSGGAEPAQLVSGDVRLSSGLQLSKRIFGPSAGKTSYVLETSGASVNVGGFNNAENTWDLKLNPQVPLNLSVESAVGEQKLDLSGMKLTALNVDLAVGRTEVILPASGVPNGEIKGAVGELVVWVPRGAAVRLNLDLGLASLTVPSDWQNPGSALDHSRTAQSPNQTGPAINLTIGQALGAVSIRYSE